MKRLDHIIETAIIKLIEQTPEPAAGGDTKKVTDNAPSSAEISPFTPAEEKFLGKFDAYGTTNLGIIYSPTDIGIREFIGRSGNDLNCTPSILLKLLRNKIINIVPYTGFGRNTDYTIELQLSLDDVKGMGAEDKGAVEAGSGASGAPAPGGEPTPPPPENAGYVPRGELMSESVKQRILTEEFNDFINMVSTTDLLVEQESAEKTYIKNKSKLKNIETALDNAFMFWSNVLESLFSGWGINWNEKKFISYFNSNLFFSGVNPKFQALCIDAIGKMVELAQSGDRKTRVAAGSFLDDWLPRWEGVLIFFENKNGFGSKPWNLQWLLNKKVIYYIVNSNEIGKVLRPVTDKKGNPVLDDKTGKPKQILKNKPAAYAFKENFYKSGLGTLVIDDSETAPTGPYGKSTFIPAYYKSEVTSLVNKLLEPYKAGTTKNPTSGQPEVDVKKLKKQTFRDTLTKQQIIQRAKYAKAQINKNMKKFAKGKPPKIDLPVIEDLVGSNAWVDEKGYGFIYSKQQNGSVIRYYPDGKATRISKSGKVIGTGKWYVEWDRPKQEWWIVTNVY